MSKKSKSYKYFKPEHKKIYDNMAEGDLVKKLLQHSNEIKGQKELMAENEGILELKEKLAAAKSIFKNVIDESAEHMNYIMKLLDARKNGKEMPTA